MTKTQVSAPGPVTYTLDQAAITTLKITTPDGEAAARAVASALDSICMQTTITDIDCRIEIPAGTTVDVTVVDPRGPASLVYATDSDGRDVQVTDDGGLDSPLDGSMRGELAARLADWRAASDGPSADAEHKAAAGLAAAVDALLTPH